MPKNHACEKKYPKCTKELTLSNNCKLVRSGRIIAQLKMERDAWQPIFVYFAFVTRHLRTSQYSSSGVTES